MIRRIEWSEPRGDAWRHEQKGAGVDRIRLLLVLGVGVLVVAGASVAVAAKISPPQEAALPAEGPGAIPIWTDANDKTWYLGGFSDLAALGSSGKEYWTLTDRGPNLDGSCVINSATTSVKAFPLPGFSPEIVKLEVSGAELHVQERIALHFGPDAATGLPVRSDSKNEPARGVASPSNPANPANCAVNLGTTKFGIDSEGVVVDPRDGSFWVSDEYVPSLLHVASDGDVLGRFVPTGLEGLVQAPVVDDVFPAVIGQRFRANRGFEGIAISPDGTELYTALQSPMQNPSSSTNGSLAIRLFKLDIGNPSSPVPVGQWVYLLDPDRPSPNNDKVSTLTWVGDDKVLVAERDDPDPENAIPGNTSNTRLWLADLAASRMLGEAWNWNGSAPNPFAAQNGGCTLEQRFLATPPSSCTPPSGSPSPTAKCLYANVAQLLIDAGFVVNGKAANGKLEGVALVKARGANPSLISFLNDNDFGILGPIPELMHVLSPAPTECPLP